MTALPDSRVETVVCRLGDIEREGAVLARVAGESVAVFRTYDDRVFALSNYDPYSRASVLARGIVGSRAVEGGETTFVASPMHKQAFRPQHRAVPRRRGGAGPDVRRPRHRGRHSARRWAGGR
jgi:nitrite reductase/ring-hydroxylating ferredoxin subunit